MLPRQARLPSKKENHIAIVGLREAVRDRVGAQSLRMRHNVEQP